MKNRTKLFTGICLLGAVGSSLLSCSNDDSVVELANLQVTVTTVESFSSVATDNLYVYLQNTTDNSKDSTLTDANGVANFIDVAPGIYNLSCVKPLTKEEAGEASGYYEEITLNGTASDVNLFGGVDTNEDIVLDGKPSSSLTIEEFYYSGANDPSYAVGFKDQFVKIYNNSSEVVYADGLYLASIVPNANGSSDNDIISTMDFSEFVYADKIAQVPGSGTEYPIEPGASITIAFNAVDYSDSGANDYTVDLSGADFELYAIDWLESLDRKGNAWMDIDNVDVTNMNMIYLQAENYGMFTFNTTGASVVIFRSDVAPSVIVTNPDLSQTKPIHYMQINVADIVDGVEMLASSGSAAFKRLPSGVDAGFNYIESGSYTSKSVRRKAAKTTADGRIIYKDTNNSTEDFEVIDVAQ